MLLIFLRYLYLFNIKNFIFYMIVFEYSFNKRSYHHLSKCFYYKFIWIASQIFGFLVFQNILQVRHFHNFSSQQRNSDFLQYLKYGLIKYNMIVLNFKQVFNKLIHLFFANLKSMI